jgi:tyrosine-protein phosphatase SIW14
MQGRVLSLLLLVSTAPAANAAIPNFHAVEADVFRGGTPGAEGIAELKALGVKTILNLDDRYDVNEEERALAQAAGIREIANPMSGFWWPENARVNRALRALSDPRLRPIYVHCQHGQDRTGLVVGLFRVEREHWAPARAYAEMLGYGFHRILFLMNHYFEERTGFED